MIKSSCVRQKCQLSSPINMWELKTVGIGTRVPNPLLSPDRSYILLQSLQKRNVVLFQSKPLSQDGQTENVLLITRLIITNVIQTVTQALSFCPSRTCSVWYKVNTHWFKNAACVCFFFVCSFVCLLKFGFKMTGSDKKNGQNTYDNVKYVYWIHCMISSAIFQKPN